MVELQEPAAVLVAKYFVFVGNVLLTLVLVADWFLPDPPALFPDRSQIESLTIRIASTRKWPEKVVFDTSQPTITIQAAVVLPVEESPAAQAVPREPGETPSMSTPLALPERKPSAPLVVSHRRRLEAKRKVARRIRSRTPVTTGMERLEVRRRCCWPERTNRPAISNAVLLKRAASSWPMDWF
jgi:hypothetical protein